MCDKPVPRGSWWCFIEGKLAVNPCRLQQSKGSLGSGKAISGEVRRAGLPPWSGAEKKIEGTF